MDMRRRKFDRPSSRRRSRHRRASVLVRLPALVVVFLVVFLVFVVGSTLVDATSSSRSATTVISNGRSRRDAINELRTLVPPPSRRALGGNEEIFDDETYARFLSVSSWDPNIAAPRLRKTIEWMTKIRPCTIRPHHCPTLCRQKAWVALTVGRRRNGGGGGLYDEDDDDDGDVVPPVDDDGRNNDDVVIGHEYVLGICALGGGGGGVIPRRRGSRIIRRAIDDDDGGGWDQPYDCPPARSWRTTRHGMPVTHFRCWKWRPDLATSIEMDRHAAYTMHHLIRRTTTSTTTASTTMTTSAVGIGGGRRSRGRGENSERVDRVCIVFDMRGFETWMLPYVHRCVNLLRDHYPGRAGAFCFINAPFVFRGVWKMICPWLDDELRSKVHFAPGDVNDVEGGIEYLNGMKLRVGPV